MTGKKVMQDAMDGAAAHVENVRCGSSSKCCTTRSTFSSVRLDSDRSRFAFCALLVVNSVSCHF